MSGFIVFTLPRSRSYWLSKFLSYQDWNCGHEELRHARSLDDVKAWFTQPTTGTVETAAAPWWRLVRSYAPDIRVVTIRRPVEEVVDSLARLGFDVDIMRKAMTALDRKLDQIEQRVPGVLSVRYRDLENESACAEVFQHCLPYAHDPKWWAEISAVNLQVSMSGLVRYMRAYWPQLEKLTESAKRHILVGMGPRKFVARDDVTIQQESCEAWFRDGKALFEEHALQLGESPDGYLNRNWGLMDLMDCNGGMQIVTARCNGRMVGYYVCYIAPATDDASLTTSTHISIFASRDFPGLGLRLQRASINMLRDKGVGEVCFRAGVRADGARMGAIYQRAGAEYIGKMYRLSLQGVQ